MTSIRDRSKVFLFLAVFLWLCCPWSAVYAQETLDGQETVDAEPESATDSPPLAPVQLNPPDGSTTTSTSDPPLGLPTLSWQIVEGAIKYHVQVATSPGFGDPLVDKDTYAGAYSLEIALPDGIYYWRVKAGSGVVYNPTWGPYSDVFSFEKDWSTGGALKPTLLEPEADAIRAAFQAGDFSWTPVAGAAKYRFELAGDPAFTNVVYDAITLKPQHTPVERLASNTYHWRVTPIDYRDNYGQSSDVRSFTFDWAATPELLAPVDDVETPFVPRFSWTAVEAAKEYRLQISTQTDFGFPTEYITRNTDFTPVKALSNDQDYFWRVRAVDYQGTGTPWSEVRGFRTKWNFAPTLLTPADNAIMLSYPFFSWEPIPGAERYQIQIDESNSFEPPLIGDEKLFNVNSYTQPEYRNGLVARDYYWRVRGLDAQDNTTAWSEVRAFRTDIEVRSNLIYPPYYYPPDTANLPVHHDRTIAWPLFLWDTAHTTLPFPVNAIGLPVAPDYYHLMVDDDPGFGSPNFQIETLGLAAAPTLDTPFAGLQNGQIYYWRVQAFREGRKLGGDAVWRMRYDAGVQELAWTPPSGDGPSIIYPRDAFEAVDAPVLGWQPVNGAANYRVQVSRNQDFTVVVDEARPQFVNYVPWQGRLEAMPFGAYWWRVQAESAQGVALGGWSQPRRFHLSVDLLTGNPIDMVPVPCADLKPDEVEIPPCTRVDTPTTIISTTQNYLPAWTFIAASPGDSGNEYDVGNLHVMTDRYYDGNHYWAIAFEAAAAIGGSVKYGIYIDVDHVENSGAAADPLGKPISTDGLFRPEYVIYVHRAGNTVASSDVSYFQWNGSSWDPVQSLASLGGVAWYEDATHGIQILVPYTSIDPDDSSGSMALAVFSTDVAGGGLVDSVPPQGGLIDNPAFVSDMLAPLYPFDTPLSNPRVLYDMPPLRWRTPIFDSIDGYQVEVARDAQFTDIVETWETYETRTSPFFELLPATFQSGNAFEDNESYYWHVRLRHERFDPIKPDFYDYGPWSPPFRFKLDSRRVANAKLSTAPDAFMTPSFEWDRVDGAAGYTIQIDDDANFSSPLVNQATDATSFTPDEKFGTQALIYGAQYFWRVAMRRSDQVVGHWTDAMTFAKTSLYPTPLVPLTGQTVTGQPTFQWTTILTPTVTPRLAVPRYRLQVDDDPNFGSPLVNVISESSTYTPPKARVLLMEPGTGEWRYMTLTTSRGLSVRHKASLRAIRCPKCCGHPRARRRAPSLPSAGLPWMGLLIIRWSMLIMTCSTVRPRSTLTTLAIRPQRRWIPLRFSGGSR